MNSADKLAEVLHELNNIMQGDFKTHFSERLAKKCKKALAEYEAGKTILPDERQVDLEYPIEQLRKKTKNQLINQLLEMTQKEEKLLKMLKTAMGHATFYRIKLIENKLYEPDSFPKLMREVQPVLKPDLPRAVKHV